jgi:hypothetical protein
MILDDDSGKARISADATIRLVVGHRQFDLA